MLQGSTISVTLFAIKINSLSRVIPRKIQVSVFVDNVQIAYSHHDLNKVQRVLQESVNSIANWSLMNGFSFSASKTVVMQFYKVRAPFLQPKIYLHNNLITEVNSVKISVSCLGS